VAGVETYGDRRARFEKSHKFRHLLKAPPSENSAPAVFSMRIWKPVPCHASPSIARVMESAASFRPS
jgi:hypothetical protein